MFRPLLSACLTTAPAHDCRPPPARPTHRYRTLLTSASTAGTCGWRDSRAQPKRNEREAARKGNRPHKTGGHRRRAMMRRVNEKVKEKDTRELRRGDVNQTTRSTVGRGECTRWVRKAFSPCVSFSPLWHASPTNNITETVQIYVSSQVSSTESPPHTHTLQQLCTRHELRVLDGMSARSKATGRMPERHFCARSRDSGNKIFTITRSSHI